MRYRKTTFLLLAMTLPMMQLRAQTEPEYCMEIGIGVGMINYEGDFNGNIFKCAQPSATLIYRYLFDPHSAIRASLDYGQLKGAAKDNKTVFLPEYESYTFNNTLLDLNAIYEYNFWAYGTGKDYRGAKRLTPYVLAGIGMTYAKTDDGSAFTANVPLGIGVKYKVARRVNLNLEWMIHFSLSDKLDGVKDPYGVKSTGIFKNTDCYSQLMINLTYSFKERCRVCHNDRE